MTGSDDYSDLAGGYVLGALGADERIAFEAHLETCVSCKRDVMEFSAIPGLLALVDEEDLEAPSPNAFLGAAAVVAGDDGVGRRRTRRWQLAALGTGAAAAILAGLLVFGAGDGSTNGDEAAGTASAFSIDQELALESEYDITGSIGLSERPWGTFILIDLFDVPQRADYTMWTVSADGTWTSVATWVWSESGTCRIPGASSLEVDQIERVVVTGAADKNDGLAWGT